MIKGILFDKDGTLLEFHSTQHYIYANVFAYLQDRYRVPGPLLQELREALGHLPDRLHPTACFRSPRTLKSRKPCSIPRKSMRQNIRGSCLLTKTICWN